ncbi:MAG: lipopolysaccharide heptosyltransferase I [Deltaproteobacteria bacterium]|nr:lipopolysaccharide heptosyltransferase I [Deltaproteobacteria bacterium]
MKVLLVKLSALGDVIMSLPVAMAIRRQRPEVWLDWVVEEPSAGILEGHPALNRVLVSPRHQLQAGLNQGLPEAGAFLGRLRAVEYDWVVDLQGLMKSAIYVTLSRGRQKVGFRGGKEPLAAWALNRRLPPFDPDRHAVERYLDLLEPLGLERPAQLEYGLIPTPAETARARELLPGWDSERPLILMHPVAKWESKLWPVASWARLAQELAAAGAQMALCGSRADAGVGQAIADQAGVNGHLVDLCGRTSLRELAALMGQARALAATDTGTMHLAAALGLPVVALFGPTAPWRTGPYGGRHRILRQNLTCSPCFKRECPDPRCLSGLEPGRVAAELRNILDQPQAGAPAR